ncbi:PP2C family protein-serine/threonine phosphatase [Methylocella silvestris]|uniref:Serine/threonine protein phosphatase n=1 Tax=Methylocella silvestris TaxID=199596 RepID=A0A2J7TI27_METSI|nr:protein phosphatase 2C domain-containing protein [Methylocella silvestris]PNG26424.1 serine/threonine protein phosphatase [Methylocella silvestris]
MKEISPKFESGAASDVGKVRLENEDAFLLAPERGVFAVADGMGGHEAGRLASSIVVEQLATVAEPASVADLLQRCRDKLARANDRLLEIADERGGIVIGATIAAVLAWEGYYACVWSGDSRIYLVRQGKIQQLSRDHTEVAELIAEGVLTAEEAQTWPRRNVITRAVGVYHELDLEIAQGVLQKDDRFIICSDGLTTHVSDAEILDLVRLNPPQTACDRLVALTLERGASDNVTVVVARYAPMGSTIVFTQDGAPKARWTPR